MNRLRQFLVGQATLVDWCCSILKEPFAQLGKSDNIGVIIGNTNAEEELKKFNFHILYKIDVNPFFNPNVETMEAIKKNSDIAVLTLETAVPLTSSVRPICLPSLSDTSNTYEGETGTVAGWGLKEDGQESVGQLLEVDVPILSNTQCKTFYQWLKRYFPLSYIPFPS